jgi:hypothetical protein
MISTVDHSLFRVSFSAGCQGENIKWIAHPVDAHQQHKMLNQCPKTTKPPKSPKNHLIHKNHTITSSPTVQHFLEFSEEPRKREKIKTLSYTISFELPTCKVFK